jgi:hypothetical protein
MIAEAEHIVSDIIRVFRHIQRCGESIHARGAE